MPSGTLRIAKPLATIITTTIKLIIFYKNLIYMKNYLTLIITLLSISSFGQFCPSIDSIAIPTSSVVLDIDISDTEVWILTEDSILQYDGSSWLIIDESNTGFPINPIVDISSDKDGNLWMLSIDTLVKYDGSSIVSYPLPDSVSTIHNEAFGNIVYEENFFVDTSGHVWMTLLGPSSMEWDGSFYGGDKLLVFTEFDGVNFTYHEIHGGYTGAIAADRIGFTFDRYTNEVHFYVKNPSGGVTISSVFEADSGRIGNSLFENYSYSNENPQYGYDYYSDWVTYFSGGCSSLGINPSFIVPIGDNCSFYYSQKNLGFNFDSTVIGIYSDSEIQYQAWFPNSDTIIGMKDDADGLKYVSFQHHLLVFNDDSNIEPVISISNDSICKNDSVLVTVDLLFDVVEWENITELGEIYIDSTGSYVATVYYNSGCIFQDTINLYVYEPYSEEICLITVDSISGFNKIVFEKTAGVRTEYFNIYKESNQAGVYNVIATLPYDSLSEYIDTSSSPSSISARYKISVVDTCNNESELSAEHKTIHLASNVGINGEVNLTWNAYEGFSYSTFDVYRGSSISSITLLTQVQSNLFSFTDQNPLSGAAYYQIVVSNSNGCVSGKRAGSYDSAVSNIIDINDTNTGIDSYLTDLVKIYPNPSNGIFNIEGVNGKTISVRNLLGQKVLNQIVISVNSLDLSRLDKGVYFIEIDFDGYTHSERVVIE